MADYDGVYPIPDNTQTFNISATSFYPNINYQIPVNNNYHGVDIDTATIVSIASSCIILISGCIAVVCLIMYMKKTDMLYRSRTCAKCGANVARDESSCSRVPIRPDSNPDQITQTPNLSYQPAIKVQPGAKKELESIVIFHGHNLPNSNNCNKFQFSTDIQSEPLNSQFGLNPGGNNKSTTSFLDVAFKDDKDEDYENDATPYATFNLPGFETDSKISDTYETFAAKFTEPPYMLLKKGLECPAPPQYADSVDYKMSRLSNNEIKTNEENIYQSTGLSQCLSIASCSSNHEELIRAYEYGKQQKQKLLKLQNEFIECLNENDGDETFYRSIPSDRESPTDPGIREFTKSPPRPNEKRQGVVLHHQPTSTGLLELSKQMIADSEQFQLKEENPVLDDSSKNENSFNETSNSLSSIQGTSSNDSTPSVGSEDSSNSEEASSSSTATPEHVPNLSDSRHANFGAIPRDRSRNPSWASFTTMKSNTVLASTSFTENEIPSERAFLPQIDNTIKEGLSSDDDEFAKPKHKLDKNNALSQDTLLEDLYGTRLSSFELASSKFGGSNESFDLYPQTATTNALEQVSNSSGSQMNANMQSGTNYQQPSGCITHLTDKNSSFSNVSSKNALLLRDGKNVPQLKKMSSEIDC